MSELDGKPDAGDSIDFLKDEVMYDLFVSKVAEVAKDKLEAETTRARNRFALILTAGLTLFLAALSGVATFGFTSLKESLAEKANAQISATAPVVLKEALKTELPAMKREMEAVVRTTIDQKIGQEVKTAEDAWNRISLTFELREKILKLERQLAFDEREIKSIIRLLKQVAEIDDLRSGTDLPELLEKFIDSLAAADRTSTILELEEEFQSEMVNTQGISWTMSLTLGRQAISFPVDPRTLVSGKMRQDWDTLLGNYHRYADAARKNTIPEVPFVFDLIVACMTDQPDPVLAALVTRADDLSDYEFDFAVSKGAELASQEWRVNEDAISGRAKKRAGDCAKRVRSPGISPRSLQLLDAMSGG